METVQIIILVIVLIVIFGPSLLTPRTPIPESSTKMHKPQTLAELHALLKDHPFVMVDFYADWCPPCRTIAPIFSELADAHSMAGKLAFAKVNVDRCQDVAREYGITAMPTFLCFRDGQPVGVGVKSGKAEEKSVVERVRGADVRLLRSVVDAVVEEVRGL